MSVSHRLARLVAFAAVGGMPCLALAYSASTASTSAAASTPPEAAGQAVSAFEEGSAGFVVSDIEWALGPDADKGSTCPNGLTLTPTEIYRATPAGQRLEGETDSAYTRRISAAVAPKNGVNACQTPEALGPDPYYRTVIGSNVRTDGIDLDGMDSRSNGRALRGTCAHDDFRGLNGERGVDNQFYRLVGCTEGFQSTGTHIRFANEMLTGAWGILISIKGVDNPLNDDDVEVGIYANADPIQLSAARKPLTYATYAADRDPRFRATTRGRIVNGVLTTEPVNVRFHHTVNNMWLERPMDEARLRLTIMKDGSLDGILAGYTNVDELFDYVVGMRSGKDAKGNLSQARFHSSLGSARAAGVTCNGMYHAMKQLADGHRDPKTGKCTALSTQYRIKAIKAFVVENPTPSRNQIAEKS